MDEKNNNLFYFSCWHIIIPKISFYSIHKYNSHGYETKKTIFIVSSKYSIRKIFHTSESQTEKKKHPLRFLWALCLSPHWPGAEYLQQRFL